MKLSELQLPSNSCRSLCW